MSKFFYMKHQQKHLWTGVLVTFFQYRISLTTQLPLSILADTAPTCTHLSLLLSLKSPLQLTVLLSHPKQPVLLAQTQLPQHMRYGGSDVGTPGSDTSIHAVNYLNQQSHSQRYTAGKHSR